MVVAEAAQSRGRLGDQPHGINEMVEREGPVCFPDSIGGEYLSIHWPLRRFTQLGVGSGRGSLTALSNKDWSVVE